jgi:hypothetical protein
LSSLPLRAAGGVAVFCFCFIARSFLALKNQKQNAQKPGCKTYLKYVANAPSNPAKQTVHESFLAKISSVDLNVKSGRF